MMETNAFHDVTNAAPSKRRIVPHGDTYRVEEKQGAATMAMVEELSKKVDSLSHKLDSIYDLLFALVPAHAMSPSSKPQAESTTELRGPAFHTDEQSVISLVKSAFKQGGSHMPRSDDSGDMEQSDPPATSELVKEAEPKYYDNKKSSSVGMETTGGLNAADLHTWPKRDCFIVLVEFKCQRVKRCESRVFIFPGQYAIVQGDRGFDCGVVNQCSEWSAEKGCFVREESLDGTVVNVSRMKSDMGRVLRVASEEEVERLFGEIARNENFALKTCRELVARLGLDMDVVDCEYQFDQQKISFYYESSRSIDFRHLNSELYRIFGVRIWLQNVNNAVKNVVPAGAMSKDDKAQYRRSGLRQPFR